MSEVTIVMYHYVRDVERTRFPGIKALSIGGFQRQLEHLRSRYHPIGGDELIAAVEGNGSLPPRAALLTFDDGYADHWEHVLPALRAAGVPGCFFPPAQCVLEHRVLDVNKIHFVLAGAPAVGALVEEIRRGVEAAPASEGLQPFEVYWARCGVPSRYDPAEVMFVKRMLQKELPAPARARLVDALFRRFVTTDEAAFAHELYMDVEQVAGLRSLGMHVGSHGWSHRWLDTLPREEQEREVDASLDFLRRVGADAERWILCYPYGGYDESLLGVIRERHCRLGLTTRVAVADLRRDDPLLLPRLDTNDLPR